MSGTLYVVATPIGNMADITLRALSTLREVDLIAAEDTRVTHNLLAHYGIDTPLTPYHQHSQKRKTDRLIEMLKDGKSIALVSDAGTPGISDPGEEIVSLAIENDIPVTAIPGPSAIITALSISGLPTRRFVFEGFLPKRSGERLAFFTSLNDESRTMAFYESPNRLISTLEEMRQAWGERQIAVVREATKLFEEVRRGTIGEVIAHFAEIKPKGEFTIIAAGSSATPEETSTDEIKTTLQKLLAEGISERDAVKAASVIYPIGKKEIYRIMIDMKEKKSDE